MLACLSWEARSSHLIACLCSAGEGLIELNKFNVEHRLADTAGVEAARAGIHLQASSPPGRKRLIVTAPCDCLFASW